MIRELEKELIELLGHASAEELNDLLCAAESFARCHENDRHGKILIPCEISHENSQM